MSLMEAFNRRLGDPTGVVPVAVPAPAPTPTYGIADPRTLREVRPGEVGYKTMNVYPDTPYSEGALRELLARTQKGAQYFLDNMGTEKAESALGLLTEVLEATHLMLIGYMANGILNAPASEA